MKDNKLDHGFAWVIVLCSFLQHFILSGYYFMHGLIYPDLLEEFPVGKVAIAWLGSLQVGLACLLGLVAGPLVVVYGCRTMCTLGGAVSGAGYIICAFAPNFPSFLFSFSIIPALGNSILYVGSCVIVQQYFEKRRSLATSVTTSGIPIGTLVFGIVCRFFLDTYGWRGNILLLGGIMLNGIPIGLLIRDPTNIIQRLQESYSSHLSLSIFKSKQSLNHYSSEHSLNQKHSLYHGDTNGVKEELTEKHVDGLSPLQRILFTKAQLNTTTIKSHPSQSTLSKYDSEIQIGEDETKRDSVCTFGRQLADTATQIGLGFKDLREPACFIMFIISLLFCMGFPGYYVFIPIKATDLGENQWKAAFLVSMLGISDLAGRFISGLLGRLTSGRLSVAFSSGVLLCGISSFFLSISYSFEMMIIGVVGAGMGLGMVLSQLAPTASELFGVDRIARIFGMMQVAFGIGTVSSPPLQAYLYEVFDNVNSAFYLAGTAQVLGGLIGIVFFALRKRRSRDSVSALTGTMSISKDKTRLGCSQSLHEAVDFLPQNDSHSLVVFHPIFGSHLSLDTIHSTRNVTPSNTAINTIGSSQTAINSTT